MAKPQNVVVKEVLAYLRENTENPEIAVKLLLSIIRQLGARSYWYKPSPDRINIAG